MAVVVLVHACWKCVKQIAELNGIYFYTSQIIFIEHRVRSKLEICVRCSFVQSLALLLILIKNITAVQWNYFVHMALLWIGDMFLMHASYECFQQSASLRSCIVHFLIYDNWCMAENLGNKSPLNAFNSTGRTLKIDWLTVQSDEVSIEKTCCQISTVVDRFVQLHRSNK